MITTRNLLDASLQPGSDLKRFVNVSSFAVYTEQEQGPGQSSGRIRGGGDRPAARRGDAYCYAKVKQDELVAEYGRQFADSGNMMVRPGSVYGPGKTGITGRHRHRQFRALPAPRRREPDPPHVYRQLCRRHPVLAGVVPGVEGQTFNIVDDDLPSRAAGSCGCTKRTSGGSARSMSPALSATTLCWLWEKYSQWSEGQLPPAFNRGRWHAEWKSTRYSNAKAKSELGWVPRVSMTHALRRYFEACREARHA